MRAWKCLAGGRDFADHAHAQGFGRTEHPSGHDQQHRPLTADEPRQFLRAATAGQDSDLHFGQAELCTLARDNNVRAQSEFEASPEGEPLHCGDYGLGAVHDRAPVFLHIARHDLDRPRFGHFADIGAGRKGNVRSRHNDAAHLAVGTAPGDLVGKPHADIEVERIADLRTIDPEDDDVLCRVFNEQGFRSGHDNQSRRFTIHTIFGERPGSGRRLFGAWVYDSKCINNTCPHFIARAGNAMSGPGEIVAHLSRSELRFRRQQQRRNPADMGCGNRRP